MPQKRSGIASEVGMAVALITMGSAIILGGAVVAEASNRWPQRRTIAAEFGGWMFLAGTALIACCFPYL
jgi:hypothetical protein